MASRSVCVSALLGLVRAFRAVRISRRRGCCSVCGVGVVAEPASGAPGEQVHLQLRRSMGPS